MPTKKQPIWSIDKVRMGVQVPLSASVRISRRFGIPERLATTDDILAALEKSVEDVVLTGEELQECDQMREDAKRSRAEAKSRRRIGEKGGKA